MLKQLIYLLHFGADRITLRRHQDAMLGIAERLVVLSNPAALDPTPWDTALVATDPPPGLYASAATEVPPI